MATAYETAARASEVLSLNVEDLELENKRARVRSKGGDVEWLHLQAGCARLLPRVIAGRSRGPLFLSDRRPAPARMPATADVCPVTWRARLSYRRAEELFSTASGGWTLHQLRHSAITHLAEADIGLALLMAKSRHTSLRSLQRYARPGSEAVAAQPATPADLGAALRANHRPGHASPPPRAIRSVRHRLRVQAVRDQHPAVVLHPGRGRAHGRRAAPGPVDGRIVSETLIGLLRADPTSYLSAHPRFKPFLGADLRLGPMVNPNLTGNRAYTHAHFLHYAGVVTPATYR